MTASSHLPPLSRLSSRPPDRRRLVTVLVVTVAVLALSVVLGLQALHRSSSSSSAESSGSSAGSSAGSSNGTADRGAVGSDGLAGTGTGAKAPAVDSPQGTGPSGTGGSGGSGAVIETKIARSAWLGIKVGDLAGSAARARVVATDAGGQVTSENVVTSADPTGGPVGVGGVDPRFETGSSVRDIGVDEARLVLSVPAKALDDVLTRLSAIGTVSYRSSQSQDVTDTYIDTKARIQPMRDGIERVRALLAKTTDLQQVITLESELSRRQADLDSLEQRFAQLEAMTTMSDVTVTLWTDATTPAPSDDGLTGGLRTAWDSLLGSLTVILTGLAALLPWLVLLVPLTLLALRIRRRRGAGMPSASSPTSPAPAAPVTSDPGPVPAGAASTSGSGASSSSSSPGE